MFHLDAILFHQYFHNILQLIYQPTFSCIYSFDKLNVFKQYSHDLLHAHLQLLGFQTNLLSHLLLSINSLHSHLHVLLFHLCLLLQTLESNLPWHLKVSCYSAYLVSLVLDIRLNTLRLVFWATSGIHIFAQGSLILLQQPLHFFPRILQGKNIGSLPLKSTISGLFYILDCSFKYIPLHCK